jgi:oligopeptide/dipeptide ABC transporter ATP-binding protein
MTSDAAMARQRDSSPLLEVRDLAVHIDSDRRGTVRAVDGVTLSLGRGEILGLVGESGSGKSLTCLALMGLLPQPGGRVVGGEVVLDGVKLLELSERELRAVRGGKIAMILQDPMSSLNPSFSIGYQVREAVGLHQGLRGASRDAKAVDALTRVRIPAAAERLRSYPHELSGGMRQRVCGAIAVSSMPQVLIADEPTTSLDVTVEAQYLQLLSDLRDEIGVAIILVTHDLSIVTRVCDRVAVMYAGRIVESGPVDEILVAPSHPYTIALFDSMPRWDSNERISSIPGRPPDPANFPAGCRFAPRCSRAEPQCREEDPPDAQLSHDHTALCWFPGPPALHGSGRKEPEKSWDTSFTDSRGE